MPEDNVETPFVMLPVTAHKQPWFISPNAVQCGTFFFCQREELLNKRLGRLIVAAVDLLPCGVAQGVHQRGGLINFSGILYSIVSNFFERSLRMAQGPQSKRSID